LKITLACLAVDDIDTLRVLRLGGSSTSVLRSAACTGAQAHRIAELWNALPDAETARCHSPGFALQAVVEGAPVFTANICWRCNNVSIDGAAAADSWRTFDGESEPAARLLEICGEIATLPAVFRSVDLAQLPDFPGVPEGNEYFRTRRLAMGPRTDGIPEELIATVQLLRSAFPSGVEVGSAECDALWAFLEGEGWPSWASGHALDFAFDLGFMSVMRAYRWNDSGPAAGPDKDAAARVVALLAPEALDRWRQEFAW
jgi:hypothetical protein